MNGKGERRSRVVPKTAAVTKKKNAEGKTAEGTSPRRAALSSSARLSFTTPASGV
jgi:hypothetical protein